MFWYVAGMIPIVSASISTCFATYFFLRSDYVNNKSRRAMTSTFFDDIHSLHYIKRLAGTQNPHQLRKILSEALGEELSQAESDAIWHVTSRWEKKNYLVNETDFFDRLYGQRGENE